MVRLGAGFEGGFALRWDLVWENVGFLTDFFWRVDSLTSVGITVWFER
jgi:hypothetical protein